MGDRGSPPPHRRWDAHPRRVVLAAQRASNARPVDHTDPGRTRRNVGHASGHVAHAGSARRHVRRLHLPLAAADRSSISALDGRFIRPGFPAAVLAGAASELVLGIPSLVLSSGRLSPRQHHCGRSASHWTRRGAGAHRGPVDGGELFALRRIDDVAPERCRRHARSRQAGSPHSVDVVRLDRVRRRCHGRGTFLGYEPPTASPSVWLALGDPVALAGGVAVCVGGLLCVGAHPVGLAIFGGAAISIPCFLSLLAVVWRYRSDASLVIGTAPWIVMDRVSDGNRHRHRPRRIRICRAARIAICGVHGLDPHQHSDDRGDASRSPRNGRDPSDVARCRRLYPGTLGGRPSVRPCVSSPRVSRTAPEPGDLHLR